MGRISTVQKAWKNVKHLSDGEPCLFSRVVAELGFKIPLSGSKEKCLERIEDLKQALNQTGKYSRRKSAAGNMEK